MRILLIHPEGGLNYNINLTGLIEILSEAGHQVTYLAPRRSNINQIFNFANVTVILLNVTQCLGAFIHDQIDNFSGYDHIITVDRGIVEGAKIANKFGVPCSLLSYEIFFKEEVEGSIKAQEITACRNLSFAITQDELRAQKLSLANEIPIEKIIKIPVAGRGFKGSRQKPKLFHEMFGLGHGVKVALYMGSLSDWTGTRYLLESTNHWPEDWTLVLHERFGPSVDTLELLENLENSRNVRISRVPFNCANDMSEFVSSANLGIALYTPTYENEWVGKNLKYIGMASGKIATYLQHGVPVATHEIGEFSNLIREFEAGSIFSLEKPFVPDVSLKSKYIECKNIFERFLDLDQFRKSFLVAIENV